MEGRQAKPTHKFYSGKKAFKQPSTCSTEKRSRTHQQIQYIPIIHPERQKRSCQSIHLPLYLHSTTSDTSWDRRRSNCKLVCEGLQAICMQKRNSRIHHIRQCQDIPERFPRAQYPKNQILNTTEPQRFLAYHQRKWKFITEWAPWWGGCYEKLIGLVKWRLKKAIRNTSLNFIELKTKLTEVEATLNSPPLTFTYTDINDGPTLTPSPFLCRLLCMSSNFARYSQWFRWFRAHTTSIKPWFIKTSEIPSKDDTEFLGTVAKGTLNQCPRTTLITKKQTFLRSCGKNFLSFS